MRIFLKWRSWGRVLPRNTIFAFILFLLVSVVSDRGFCKSVDVVLDAGGAILTAPAWRDSSSVEIFSLSFPFSGTSSIFGPVNVDSDATLLRLTDAPAYPAQISVVLPSSCSIGATPVSDSHVKLLVNGIPAFFLVQLASAINTAFSLRFQAAGSYGKASGNVVCAVNGLFRYSY